MGEYHFSAELAQQYGLMKRLCCTIWAYWIRKNALDGGIFMTVRCGRSVPWCVYGVVLPLVGEADWRILGQPKKIKR